jgi:hypothetical protein
MPNFRKNISRKRLPAHASINDRRRELLQSGIEKFDEYQKINPDHVMSFSGVMREQRNIRNFQEFMDYTGNTVLDVINLKLEINGKQRITREEFQAIYESV